MAIGSAGASVAGLLHAVRASKKKRIKMLGNNCFFMIDLWQNPKGFPSGENLLEEACFLVGFKTQLGIKTFRV
jgi:hypothetical protein